MPLFDSKTPAWPFVVLSFFGGVYALLPYFALWSPPSPPVSETEPRQWPLNVLESKVTAGVRDLLHSHSFQILIWYD